jgi:hypothetical protein
MSCIKRAIIEELPEEWTAWRKVNRNDYMIFNKQFPDNVYFCSNVLDSKHKKDFELVEIIERIGSPSADGEVYRINYGELDFAMKLMPRVDNSSEERNKREIRYAVTASQYPDYFPKVFAVGYCENSDYYRSTNNSPISSFIPQAIQYNRYNKIKQSLKGVQLKRFEADYRNKESLIDLAKKYDYIESEKNNDTIQVDFLISELVNGDLGSWSKLQHALSDWKKIILDVVIGTYYLSGFLKIIHVDLHMGNILIGTDDHEIKALIHDFGRCLPIDENDIENSNQYYKTSLLSFCNEFIACSTRKDLIIPIEIISLVKKLKRTVENTEMNLSNLKEIYENVLYKLFL